MIDPTQVILHSAVDAPGETDLYGYFARADVTLESTFFVQNDGDIIQYMDTVRQADANRDANVRAISIETEDDGNPDQRPWTPAQLASIKRLIDWLISVHPKIARRVCPAWDQPGIGYHTMWGAPSHWTPVSKTCPGRVRIQQFDNDITPWLLAAPTVGRASHMQSLTTHPNGKRVDLAIIGADGSVWHAAAATPDGLATAKFEWLAGWAKSISSCWANGEYVITVQGAGGRDDNKLYINRYVNDGVGWTGWYVHPTALMRDPEVNVSGVIEMVEKVKAFFRKEPAVVIAAVAGVVTAVGQEVVGSLDAGAGWRTAVVVAVGVVIRKYVRPA